MRNTELGQVWTPEKIAIKMAKIILEQTKTIKKLKILDPAVGPATFSNALFEVGLLKKGKNSIVNYDIDKTWVKHTNSFTNKNEIKSENINKNYLLSNHEDSGKFDVVIMNPPYIRHEKIEKYLKDIYIERFEKEFDCKIDGRSNLFVYFILKAIQDLKTGGILCVIVYDGIENTKYGKQLVEILEQHMEVIKLEKTKMPFDDVLVDAVIITGKKRSHIKLKREIIVNSSKNDRKKFTYLKDIIDIKRGTELINNKLFLAEENEPYFAFAKDFFKKQSKLKRLIIPNTWSKKAYVFDNNEKAPKGFKDWIEKKGRDLIDNKIIESYKTLENHLKNKGNEWYKHKTITGDIVFNYYFREDIKYLLNPTNITISNNYYAINPLHIEKEIAWLLLNTDLYKNSVMKNSRPQGNGLSKIQVYEYKNSIIPDWRFLNLETIAILRDIAIKYIETEESILLKNANSIVENYFS